MYIQSVKEYIKDIVIKNIYEWKPVKPLSIF